MIIVKPINGLANRMQVVFSWHALAHFYGHELRICWEKGDGFSDASFSRLFDFPLKTVSSRDFADFRKRGLHISQYEVSFGAVRTLSQTKNSNFILTYEGYEPAPRVCPDVLNYNHLNKIYFDTLKNLNLSSGIATAAHSICQSFFKERVYGLHIRRGDAMTSSSRECHRISRMQDFLAKIAAILRDDPEAKFFLATDSKQVQVYLVDMFEGRIITNPGKSFVKSLNKMPKENQEDALIDMFCLSRTKYIVGSYYSSFSQMAGRIGAIEVRIAQPKTSLKNVLIKLKSKRKYLQKKLYSTCRSYSSRIQR